MNKEEFIQNLRANRIIKGNRPAYVTLKKNFGNIYNGRSSDFILSIRNNELIFQKISLFKGLKPALDFKLKMSDFKHFRFVSYNMLVNVLSLYDYNRNFIEIYYNTKRKDSYETEVNMNDIVKRLVDAGITELPIEEENYEESDS